MNRFRLVQITLAGCALAITGNSFASAELPPLAVQRSGMPAIIDNQQRTVLLRGVNLNALGDYYQANANYPTVIDASEHDFAEMAKLGMNVVRLVINWSALQPERDHIDYDYIDRIKTMVGHAKKHGLYTIIDMHQDAWGKYIASNGSEQCGFFETSIGWDGAPQWATLTNGASTCRLRVREISPAVATAFENFWRNREGIQDELIKVWSVLAREFADEPAVAGYDLLNEPNFGLSVGISQTLLMGNYYTKAIRAIRAAEKGVPGGFAHIAFFEPSVEWSAFGVTLMPLGLFLFDNNIVFAPHLYSGSITVTGTIGSGFQAAKKVADLYRTPFWSGEWGWFGSAEESESQIWAYAQHEDAYRIGGAVWQWKQACGDPHAQGIWYGREIEGEQNHVNITWCPGDLPLRVSPAYQRVLSRARPLYAPGDLVALRSNPYTGSMRLEGNAKADSNDSSNAMLLLWVPEREGVAGPEVRGGEVHSIVEVPGGYHVSVTVASRYAVEVDY